MDRILFGKNINLNNMKITTEQAKEYAKKNVPQVDGFSNVVLKLMQQFAQEMSDKRNKEANDFIKQIAELLNMDSDGIGFDGLTFSIDDFESAIKLMSDKAVEEYIKSNPPELCEICEEKVFSSLTCTYCGQVFKNKLDTQGHRCNI